MDKYSEKLKKLVVFSAFQSVYPLVRMTDSFFVRFAFSFGLRYNSPSKTKTRSAEHDEDLLTGTNSGEGEGLLFYGSTIIPFKDKFDKTLKLYSLMTTKPEEVEARKQKEMEE